MISTVKLVDFVERTGATFAQAFLAVALVSGVSDLTALKAAGVAGAIAAGKFAAVQAQAFLNSAKAPTRAPQPQAPKAPQS